MKYEKEINQLLKEELYEDGMSDKEFNEIQQAIFDDVGIDKEVMDIQIQTGLEDGYSMEEQLKLVRGVIRLGK